MIAPLDARGSPASPRGGWRWVVAGFVVYALVIAVLAGVRADPDPAQGTSDFRDFWRTAGHFRVTGEIRSDLGVHNYPPFFVILMVPWSLLPLRVAAGLFAAFSVAVFALGALMTEILLLGRLPRRPRASLLIAVALLLPYVTTCALLGNLGLLVVFLIIAGWFLAERGAEWEAGLAVGLAILVKIIPAALLVFFVLKGRWRVAASALIVAVALGLGVPMASLGVERTIAESRGFFERAAVEHSAYATITADTPRKAKFSNQSLPVVLRRLLSPVNADAGTEGRTLFVNVADVPRNVIFAAYLAIIAGVLVVSGHVTFWRARRWPPEPDDDALALRRQFGMWCCVMLLASPLLWTHYFPLVFWPVACVAHSAFEPTRLSRRGRGLERVVLIAWLIGMGLLAWPAARAAGVHTWLVLSTWAYLCCRVWWSKTTLAEA